MNNFEIVATAVIALCIFREPVGKRLWLAISLITLSSILLTLDTTEGFSFSFGSGMGALIVALVLGEQFVALGWLAATMALGFVAYGFVKPFIAFCGCLFID